MSGVPPSGPEIDLTNCDREAIHVPGSVQPHGVLLALREHDLVITHASANAALIAPPPAPAVGADLRAFLGPEPFDALRRGLPACDGRPLACHAGTIAAPSGTAFDVLAHRQAGSLILEFEPRAPLQGGDAERLEDHLAAATARLERAASVEDLGAATAAAVRRLTGFDKVMLYQFDDDWNGTVLAEDGPPEMDAYLGLRFPASDIPAQARELYRLNPVRLIADVDYAPAPLLASPDAAAPLDLTYAVLRSVSPVHVEYLKNMRVAASMSVSIVRGGRLWGLIACHHRAPRYVPHAVRSACTILAQFVAQLVSSIESRREADYAARVRVVQSQLLKRVAGTDQQVDALADHGDDLLRVAGATGAAVCLNGECRLLGVTPAAEDVSRLGDWLAATGAPPLFHTDWLPGQHADADRYRDRAAGVLAVTLSSVYRNYVMWFRPERVQTVTWAGNPDKPVEPQRDEPRRLHPRKSFAAWTEQVGRRSAPWRPAELDAAASLREALVDAQLRRAEEAAARAKDQFLAVLSHELRTPLSPVLTAASALEYDESLPPGARDIMRMIRRNVELETRLIDDLLDVTRISKGKLVMTPAVVDVHTLVEHTIEVCERDLHEKGIHVTVAATAAAHHVEGDPARLQQVLWNILKNAIKFTPPGGAIAIRTVNQGGGGGRVRVEVTDSGAGIDPAVLPHIFNAFEQGGRTVTSRYGGLGLGLAIARTLVELHRGRLTAASAGKGHGATFTVDLPTVPAPAKPAARPKTAGAADDPAAGTPRLRILLVEDHKDTAKVMARLLEQANYEIRTADSIDAARRLVAGHAFDLVISDLGLPDGNGTDLMVELRARHGIKGIALTGWGMEDDVRRSREAGFDRHLTKPVNFQALKAAIREVTAG